MKIASFVIFLALAQAAIAFQYESKLEDAKLEAKAQEIFKQIRCIVCDGESLVESNAETSIDMRAMIREQIKDGANDAELINFLTDRFGQGVLQEPPIKPSTYFLWFAPILFLLFGFIFMLRSKN